ncbi:Leucine-rich repeat serine/threonine-protein kinase 2 [Ceratobasidium sp. 395]|nr:Leucine-rich repeat serine/threonine-protein kinase 2 [Ceratobasidium sp. 395]
MLTDFGNAVLQDYTLNFTETTQKNSLSARWTAPEVMHGSPNSAQADVFALGMEAITGKVPFSGTKNNLVVIAAIMSRELPARPEEHIPSKSHHGDILWSLLRSCWEFEPVKRPSAADVAKSMSGINHRGLMPAFVEEPTV